MGMCGELREILSDCCRNEKYSTWKLFFEKEMQQPYFKVLDECVSTAMEEVTVYPPKEDIFRAFLTPLPEIRCVVLGQDPYHEPGQAMGLAFSVREGIKAPPSLVNIRKEMASDLGGDISANDLTPWTKSGVFLLNTCLTVEKGKAFSHSKFGWQKFTLHALEHVANDGNAPLAVILWGKPAQKYKSVFEKGSRNALIIESAHPSPLSAYRGFFGSRPFSAVNDFLRAESAQTIRWIE